MKKIRFTKMVASGNDFIVVQHTGPAPLLARLARNMCDRKYGIGADGLLVVEKSRSAAVRMRVFNADGSEAEMCGNGARCVALFTGKKKGVLETKAGIIAFETKKDKIKVQLTDPRDIQLDVILPLAQRELRANFINTGVPHAVIFVDGLDTIDVVHIGGQVRHHREFQPHGTNVDFVEVRGEHTIAVRTYERGVEDETLACGTGAAASGIIFSLKTQNTGHVLVQTKSGETLAVDFARKASGFTDVWLEGKAGSVFTGSFD